MGTSVKASVLLTSLAITFAFAFASKNILWTANSFKTVSTYYSMIQPCSTIQCAGQCFIENHQGKCNTAGYNKATHTCYLSVDNKRDVLDVTDGMMVVMQDAIDECASNPCQNGGTCLDLFNKYSCGCASGYSGITCEIDINECASNPCQNGGTCVDLVNSYNCDCSSGYTGITCQIDIDECADLPCLNGGTCNDLVADFSCKCANGYAGHTCQTGTSVSTTCAGEDHLVSGSNPIPDADMTASSEYNSNFLAHFARINGSKVWLATQAERDTVPPNFYIQVKFLAGSSVVAVQTQGHLNGDHVTSFRLEYSGDCVSFQSLVDANAENEVFPGNTDGTTIVTNPLPAAIDALCVRLFPLTWTNWPDIRLDYRGCSYVV